MDIRESKEYIASSDKERRCLIKKQNKIDKRADKMPLRRKIKTGKKAIAMNWWDGSGCKVVTANSIWGRGATFKTEASRVQQCHTAEDQARDLSGAGGANGHNRGDNDQKALELQKVNEDSMKLAMELLRWRHKHQKGQRTLQYRADEVTFTSMMASGKKPSKELEIVY